MGKLQTYIFDSRRNGRGYISALQTKTQFVWQFKFIGVKDPPPPTTLCMSSLHITDIVIVQDSNSTRCCTFLTLYYALYVAGINFLQVRSYITKDSNNLELDCTEPLDWAPLSITLSTILASFFKLVNVDIYECNRYL